ncbi:hypothetical protein DRQ53_13145 [bacterium]|nr:MAG: hypothetical protein DRQ53_13145 [bacterium]
MNRTGIFLFATLLTSSAFFFQPSEDAPKPLRIMTFNAEWLVYTEDETDKDPWGPEFTLNEHFERIAGIIETLEPDIVNLVEITSEDALDYLIDILHAKGMMSYKGYHAEGSDPLGQDISVITKLTPDSMDGKKIQKFYSSNMNGPWRAQYSWSTAGGVSKSKSTSVTKNAVYYFTIHGHKIGFLGLHCQGPAKRDHSWLAQAGPLFCC